MNRPLPPSRAQATSSGTGAMKRYSRGAMFMPRVRHTVAMPNTSVVSARVIDSSDSIGFKNTLKA